jgi:catechol 2,3-dioxygenase-like lactoylglutathione lyase family enzyme
MVQAVEKEAWPKGISVLTLFVEDLALTKKFYQEILNLPLIFEDNNSAVLKFSNILINLLKLAAADELIKPAKAASREAGARFVFTLEVEAVDARCAELAALGVKLLNGPMDRPWGVRTASFSDPAGYLWEIAQQL